MTTAEHSRFNLEDGLRTWIEQQLGGRIAAVERVPGGASRQSFFIPMAGGARTVAAVLRMEGGRGPMSGTVYTLAREARLFAAIGERGVAVPRVFGFNAQYQALLMERIAGSADYAALQHPEERRAIETDLIRKLAHLHSVAIDFSRFIDGPAPATVTAALAQEVNYWRGLYRERSAEPEPIIDFAFDWLARNQPLSDAAPALVHGDIGPGNFIFADGKIGALIDWEIAHPGHPLEDVATIIARTLGIPFGDLRALVARYAEFSGSAIQRDELGYCLVFVLTKCCVGIGSALAQPEAATDVPMLQPYSQVNQHAQNEMVAAREGVAAPAAIDADIAGDNEEHALFQHGIAALESLLLPGLADPFLQYRARGLATLLQYLRDVSDYGADRWRAEQLSALSALLGTPIATRAAGLREFTAQLPRADAALRRAMLRWLLDLSAQRHRLLRTALGDMYNRHLDFE
jgi:aminoglycoside phosphotransferase (APT) family kinase protein